MNKKLLILINILLIASLLLTACGPSSLSIQLPGSNGSSGSTTTTDNTLIYVLIGALVLVVLVALLGKRGSQ